MKGPHDLPGVRISYDGRTCTKPDRDEPRMTCGYPLPCPHHTITIEANPRETIVTIPIASSQAANHYERLLTIGEAIPTKRKRKARRR